LQFYDGGALQAVGTAGSPITFKGYWLNFASDSSGLLDHVVMDGFGTCMSDAGLYILSNNVTVQNSTFRNYPCYQAIHIASGSPSISGSIFEQNSTGLQLSGSGSPEITGNTFTGNSFAAIAWANWAGTPVFGPNTFSGNGFDGVSITGSSITGDATWPIPPIPVQLRTYLYVLNHATLTVMPGTTVDLNGQTLQFYDGGALQAVGTAGSPITFKGYWLNFASDSSGLLDHVIMDGANTCSGSSALYLSSNGVTVQNSTFRNYNYCGGSAVTVASANPILAYNNIYNNDRGLSYACSGGPPCPTLAAEHNYWGAEDGPRSDGQPCSTADGSGDTVSCFVDFTPWLTDPWYPPLPGPLNGNLRANPSSVPADGASTASVILSNAPAWHRVQLTSGLSKSVLSPATGMTDGNGRFTATIRSPAPGAAIITAQDLTAGASFPASASVTFTPVNSEPPPPPPQVGNVVIAAVRPQHPLDARYLQGIPVPNRVDVTVDWKGTAPGRVNFILNGTTVSKTTSGTTASHTFDMGADLRAGSNSLRIVAVNAAGQSSQPMDYAPYSVPKPAWLAGLQAVGAIAPMVMGGSVHAGYEYEAKVKFPPGGISLGAPGFGPPGSTTELGFFVGGGLSLPLVCNSPVKITGEAGAEAEIDLLGVELGGELKGSGNLEGRAVQCEIPTVNGNFRVDIKVYGQKNWPVLVFAVNFIAPGVGDTLQAILPYDVLALLGEVYLQGNLSGFFSSGVQVIPESPYLEWQGVSVGGGPGVETGYQFEQLGVKFKVYLGASGTIELTNPNPLRDLTDLHFDHVTLRGEAGYTVQVLWWEEGEKLYVEWRYPAGMARSAALANAHRPAWRLIGHAPTKDYATFRAAPATR